MSYLLYFIVIILSKLDFKWDLCSSAKHGLSQGQEHPDMLPYVRLKADDLFVLVDGNG